MYDVLMMAENYFSYRELMRACLAALAVLAAGPAAAAEPVDAAQKRCFCVKFSEPGTMPPYYLAKIDWEECKGRKLDFMEGRTVYDTGLLNCDDLMACLDTPKKEKELREAAMRKAADVTSALLACCPKDKGACDKACVAKLEPELKKAKAASLKLEQKALRRQDRCIAGKQELRPPAEGQNAPAAAPGGPMGAGN